MDRQQIYFLKKQVEALKRLAKKEKIAVSFLVRRIVDEYFKKK